MTIVVAAFLDNGQFAMGSDSLATGGNGLRVPAQVPKFHVGKDFMVGVAGSYQCFLKLKLALSNIPPGQENPDAIVDMIHQINQGHRDEWDSSALFINKHGIWEIDRALSIIQVDTTYHAIGSGVEAALGYLTGQILPSEREFINQQELLIALGVCCELLVTCGEPLVYNLLGEANIIPEEEIVVDKNLEPV